MLVVEELKKPSRIGRNKKSLRKVKTQAKGFLTSRRGAAFTLNTPHRKTALKRLNGSIRRSWKGFGSGNMNPNRLKYLSIH